MKREARKELNQLIKDLHENLPSEKHHFEKVLNIKLVGRDIEVHSINYGKNKEIKKEFTAIAPDNKKDYQWEDVLYAFLLGAKLPIMILQEYEKEMAEKMIEQKKAEAKMIAIKEAENKKALENAVKAEVVN